MQSLSTVCGFALRSAVVHLATYMVIGALSYYLLARPEWTGPGLRPWMRNPESEVVLRWLVPVQVVRGVLHGLVLFPIRGLLLTSPHGGLVIAVLLLGIGSLGGVSGVLEQALYTVTFDLKLYMTHLPEIVIQTVLYGFILLGWERRAAGGSPANLEAVT